MITYNSTRETLLMKEYGRNIQTIVRHIAAMENAEEQKKNLEAMIKIMGFLNPNFKKTDDNIQKIWDHMVIISDFKLAKISPYPLPQKEHVFQEPSARVTYPKKKSKYLHFGENLETLAEQTISEKDVEKQKDSIKHILIYIRLLQSQSEKIMSNQTIKNDFSLLTQKKLDHLDWIDTYLEYLETVSPQVAKKKKPFHSSSNKKNNSKFYRKTRNR